MITKLKIDCGRLGRLKESFAVRGFGEEKAIRDLIV